MPEANFFLIGAAKAGTTSIARFLELAPGAYFAPIKEPCHFSPDINAESRAEFRRQMLVDLDSYIEAGMPYPLHMHQVEKPEQYARLFQGAEGAMVRGECSTFYMPSRVAAERIHAYNPEARIMAVLRDPISRIRSHYLMDIRIGLERRPLSDCIEEEMALGDRASFANCRMYVSQSDYAPQIARYAALFPAERLLILKFEEVMADPAVWLPRILRFVGLPADALPPELPRENSSDVMPRFRALDGLLYRSGLKSVLRHHLPRLLPEPLKQAVKHAYIGEGSKVRSTISDDWERLAPVRALSRSYGEMTASVPA